MHELSEEKLYHFLYGHAAKKMNLFGKESWTLRNTFCYNGDSKKRTCRAMITLDTMNGAEEANREVHLTPAETDRQKKGSRTELWRAYRSCTTYEAKTNW